MIELELRNNLAPFIPGWEGAEQVAYLDYDSDGVQDQAAVALVGGSARIYITQGPRTIEEVNDFSRVLLNVIVFDPSFRGGGQIKTVPGSPDVLLCVPGPGGGPVVAQLQYGGTGGIASNYFAPYGESYRGGLFASFADIDRDGEPEALFLNRVGPSRLIAVDMQTFETEYSIFIGGEGVRFEPTGGTVDGYFSLDRNGRTELIPLPVNP